MRRVALLICLCTSAAVAQPADWQVERDPFDDAVVARYKAVLARDPFDRALTTLIALYRKHRSVARLERELAATRESWATAIVLARLAEARHDKDRALALYTRAAELNDRDARTWLAIGRTSTTTAAARAAYERALALSPPRPLQRAALRELLVVGDGVAQLDAVYARLIALDPTDGELWLDRADLLASHRMFAPAIEAYTAAIGQLASDPERRIYALAQRGHARHGAGDATGALADYDAAITRSPRGHYLVADLVDRVIEIHTARDTLPELLRRYQRAWPARKRGPFEWMTLARLHEAVGDLGAAIDALQRAAARAPGDLTTQRTLADVLDRAGRRTELLATLAEMSRTHARSAGVHLDLAERYRKLGRFELAIAEYETALRLDPDDAIVKALGEAHWAAGNQNLAVATWQRLTRAGTAAGYTAFATLLSEHDLGDDALGAYSRAIDLDPRNPELWRARGAVYESQERWSPALSDTSRAVALLGTASRDAGHATRYQLIRILVAMGNENDARGGDDELESRLADWQLAFAVHGDVAAGYLLAEYHGRQPEVRLASILERLRELVPGDYGLALELVRTYRVLGDYDKALALVGRLRRSQPDRDDELDALVARIRVERARPRPRSLLERHGVIRDPEPEIRARREPELARDVVRGGPARFGVRVGVGAGLRGPASRTLSTGAIGTFGSGPIAFVGRVDFVQRSGEMRSVSALGGSVGVAGRVLARRGLDVTLGAAQRYERRFGDMLVDWERNGFAADFTLDVVPRDLPTAFGVRFEQGLSDGAQSSMLLFELSVELR